MKMPNKNDAITITNKVYVEEEAVLNILPPSRVTIKEKNDDYIIIESSYGITEVNKDSGINLFDDNKEIVIKKGESKTLTLPMTDYIGSVTIEY